VTGADAASPPAPGPGGRLSELVRLFLRLGFTAFGGPAAHIAMMHDEVVRRRRWLPEKEFVDLVGAANLVPGPNSTELAIHLGHRRAGVRGLLVAGLCFIGPAALMVGVLAWAYLRYGQTPVVIAIIGWSVGSLVRTAVDGWLTAVVAVAALTGYLLGINELVLVAAGGAVAAVVRTWRPRRVRVIAPWWLAGPYFADPGLGQLGKLFLIMLKIGTVLYGSGYVLFAFLHDDFVVHRGWLTAQQLADGVAIGQLTPGPLFTSATFVGYVVAGVPGAVLATIAIFLPAFLFAGFLDRLVRWIRGRAWSSAALDGINAAALALMAGVALHLGRTALIDPLTIGLAAGSVLVLWRTRLNSTWLILVGALVGLGVATLS